MFLHCWEISKEVPYDQAALQLLYLQIQSDLYGRKTSTAIATVGVSADVSNHRAEPDALRSPLLGELLISACYTLTAVTR